MVDQGKHDILLKSSDRYATLMRAFAQKGSQDETAEASSSDVGELNRPTTLVYFSLQFHYQFIIT